MACTRASLLLGLNCTFLRGLAFILTRCRCDHKINININDEVWKSTVLLCHHCVDKDKPPKVPIANITYYGALSRIKFPLEQPSDLEVMLNPAVRLYHVVTKFSRKVGKAGRGILKGDLTYFLHDCPGEILKSLARIDTMEERV